MSRRIDDYLSFRRASHPLLVSRIDYVHAVHTTKNLPADFVVWLARMYWPEFTLVDGMV